jgi:hypothetical protein
MLLLGTCADGNERRKWEVTQHEPASASRPENRRSCLPVVNAVGCTVEWGSSGTADTLLHSPLSLNLEPRLLGSAVGL